MHTAKDALTVSATCNFCGGSVMESHLKGAHICERCHVVYDNKNSHVRGTVYEFDILHEQKILECAFCKCEIGKYYVKQKPPELPTLGPVGPLYDYADLNTQKMLAYLYKQHRGSCRVLMALGLYMRY